MPEDTKDPKKMSKAEVHEELEKTKQKLHRERRKHRELRQDLASVPRKQLHGFVEFIREKGVVGLAVGLAIGTAATGLVTQIVNSLIVPAVNLFIGEEGLKAWEITINLGKNSSVFPLGSLADALIKFLAIAAVIYFVVMGLKLDRLDKKKES